MQNFVGRNQNRSASPVQNEVQPAKASESKERDRIRKAEAMKMSVAPTKLAHNEAGHEDNHSLGGDSSITANTLKEKPHHRPVEYDNFATDDEHADVTTTGSLGFDYHQNPGMPSHYDHLESQEHEFYDDVQSQVDDEEAPSQLFDQREYVSDMRNKMSMMYNVNALRDSGSFPATTNGDFSEPEVEDEVANGHGQEVDPPYQPLRHAEQQFTANLAQRSAPSFQPSSYGHQSTSYGRQAIQDPFRSVYQQASTTQRNLKPTDLAPVRATETGSPRPYTARLRNQDAHLQTRTKTSSHEQPSAPNGKPSTASQPQAPSAPAPAVHGIQANSHKTLSTPDEPSLDSSNISELPLDYDEEKLRTMTFEQLANESFDYNPRLDASRNALADSPEPLPARLAALQNDHSAAEQAAFFASLSIDEYDDAGAWFAQQFAAIVARVSQARRDKRRVAQQFEDEIRQRHDLVTQKKRRLDDEIAKMRGKGQDLLPKTPGKSRAGSAMR
ncbi:extracellular mutant protein 11-domain-containing protein [Phyllosticta citribraziliensis]|uniref:Extracellular mutant protein 11-domain-containing protein n=1 Tax=Phyllosticta citribraziliensis TaxID=989973 RepID=A0ABR1M149_9PEZI